MNDETTHPAGDEATAGAAAQEAADAAAAKTPSHVGKPVRYFPTADQFPPRAIEADGSVVATIEHVNEADVAHLRVAVPAEQKGFPARTVILKDIPRGTAAGQWEWPAGGRGRLTQRQPGRRARSGRQGSSVVTARRPGNDEEGRSRWTR